MTDFDGCGRDCRKPQAHTRVWGSCQLGVEPPPTLTRYRLAADVDEDGYQSLVGETLTAAQVAEWLTEQGYTVVATPEPANVVVAEDGYEDCTVCGERIMVSYPRGELLPHYTCTPGCRGRMGGDS